MLNGLGTKYVSSRPYIGLVVSVFFLALTLAAEATTFVHLTAENGSSVDTANNNYVENGTSYAIIYKPSPPATWTPAPWIDSTHFYNGSHSIGMEIDPQSPTSSGDVDKVNIRYGYGGASFALTNSVTRYTGFAVMWPSATNPTPTARYLFTQWWQGSPYHPAIAFDIIPNTSPMQWHALLWNSDTGGNPSSTPVTIPGSTISLDTWHTFVVEVKPDYYGYTGILKVWQDGVLVVDQSALKIGYDPSTDPYCGPNCSGGSGSHPDTNIDEFIGPYRNRQATEQQMFFDEVSFTDTYAEAVPAANNPDFSVSASPASQTVTAGGITSYTASVTPNNGFTGAVNLGVSGLPSGATGTFSPASISGGSGSSTLNVGTTTSTPAGTYTLTATGTSGSLSHNATATLIVNAPPPPPDFSLSVSPASQGVAVGGGASYTITVSALNGFSGTVTLNVSGLPAGATAGFTSASVSGSGTSTLNVLTSSTTPAGASTLTITGVGGTLTHSATVALTVSLPHVAAPAFSPTGGSYSAAQSVTISSTTSGASIRYTTDGSTPSETAGTLYSGPVAINGNATLNAIAYESGMVDSAVSSAIYTITLTGLPSGWADLDIGSPGLAGSASFSNGTFTLNGSGADIWGTSDQFHFAYTPSSGDVTVTARVASQQNTNAWAKSGAMIRETTAANSSFVDVWLTPGHGVDMQYRPSTGASAVNLAQTAGRVAPYWVRLVRSGNTFTGYTSSDGVTWTELGSIGVSMASNATAGLAVTSHNTAAVNTSTFDNVTVSAPLPSVAAPTFSPAGGTYSTAQSVTISTTTSGASIRFTTDGSIPSESAGTLYSGPVMISSTTTLKAIAYESGMADSTVASAIYSFGPGTLPVAATSESGDDGGGHTVAMTIDGNYSTYWQSTTDGVSSAWVQYDLGSNKTVSSVAIAWYLGDTRSTWFDVDTSTDGVNWTTATSTNSSGTTTALETYSFTSVAARYVRYVCYGTSIDNVNAIAETQITGQ